MQERQQLEQEMSGPTFWKSDERSKQVIERVKILKLKVEPFKFILNKLHDCQTMFELLQSEPEENHQSHIREFASELEQLAHDTEKLEFRSHMSDPHDFCGAYFTIHSGAGGTEACDWASMLLRMYRRWVEDHGMKEKIIDYLAGEEAGVKSITLLIEGEYAYGFLKAERGVHRLVRISPFDANKKRHTSFASVDVVPDLPDDEDIDINEAELKIDTYRATGAGGQHVNTTDSAVRITHMPTGIVVQCQNERSQHKNRHTALKMLKAKLLEVEEQKKSQELAAKYGEKSDIGWGSQIRSYVFHPYSMVKDLRTDVETSNVQGVMDGDLDPFIYAYLGSTLNK